MTSPPPAPTLHLLQAVCENATVALFVMDERQHCIYMNRSAEKLTGFTLAQVQGAPLHDFVHHTRPDGRPYPLCDCPIDRAAPQNNQEQGEEVFVHRDGRFYRVAFTASPIREDGQVIGTVIEVRPLAERQQREAEREAFREVAQLILGELRLDGIVQAVTESALRLTGAQVGAFACNRQASASGPGRLLALAGWPPHAQDRLRDTLAQPCFRPAFGPDARHDAAAPVDARARDGARPGGSVRVEDLGDATSGPRADGTSVRTTATPPLRSALAVPVVMEDGEVFGVLFLGHGRPAAFTAAHERLVESLAAQGAVGIAKARLFEAAEAARDTAEAEAREKERLYREATEAGRLKDEFLATVSHELRTPLTSILGWTKMLAAGNLPPEMAQRAIGTIDRNARAQAQIIEDLLDISRITSGKLRLRVQLFQPAQAVEAAVEAVRPAAIAKDIPLQVLIDPEAGPVSGDPDRLQQVVWNLVANAVKFTEKGGRVQVILERCGSQVCIRVRDTGRGIEPAFLPRLFDRFSQGDASHTREHGGLGLGLAIVKQLVEMHGGCVEAESAGPGHGAVFTVQLPLAPLRASMPMNAPSHGTARRDALSAADGPVSQVDLSGCRVLLVEDDEDARHMLSVVLQTSGARVVECASAQEGLDAFEQGEPSVVVSDIGMPGTDGYAFIRRLRERETALGRPSVPAVALTAFTRIEDRLRALSEGFQMHVAKPVEPVELLAVIATLRGWRPG